METDFSSGAVPAGVSMPDYNAGFADFQNTWLGKLLTGTGEAQKQEFWRSELSANNQYLRDLSLQDFANRFAHDEALLSREFNALEAQKQRDFDERMSNTAYQRAVADMKEAGINPVLLLASQGGASTPQGASASSSPASSSGARSSGTNYRRTVNDNSALIVGSILAMVTKVAAGLIGQSHFKVGF